MTRLAKTLYFPAAAPPKSRQKICVTADTARIGAANDHGSLSGSCRMEFQQTNQMAAPDNGYPKPGLRDWILLGIAATFVLAGMVAFPSNPNVGIVTMAFFGLCGAVFASTIIRKLRFRRLHPL